MHHDSDCHDSASLKAFSTIDNYRRLSLQLPIVLIVFVPENFLLLLYHSEAFFFLSKATKYRHDAGTENRETSYLPPGKLGRYVPRSGRCDKTNLFY